MTLPDLSRFWTAVVLLLVLAAPTGAAGSRTLTIPGTGDSQKLLRILADRFEAQQPGARIEIPESIGSSGGLKALMDGRCRMARIARPLKPEERAAGVRARIFAVSPVVFMVNPSVEKVSNLSAQEVLDLFRGNLVNWQELGGAPGKIYLATREAGDSSRRAIDAVIPGFDEVAEARGKIIYSTPDLIDTVSSYRQTIGYGPLAMARGTDLRILAFEGVEPDPAAVAEGRYPITVLLALAWVEEPSGIAREFRDFVSSPLGRRLILEYGAVPVENR